LLANLGKPKPGYIKHLDNILFGFGLSKLGIIKNHIGSFLFEKQERFINLVRIIPKPFWLQIIKRL